jgi:hypothetical protein
MKTLQAVFEEAGGKFPFKAVLGNGISGPITFIAKSPTDMFIGWFSSGNQYDGYQQGSQYWTLYVEPKPTVKMYQLVYKNEMGLYVHNKLYTEDVWKDKQRGSEVGSLGTFVMAVPFCEVPHE